MRQLTISESMAMCDFQAMRDDVVFIEWTGEEYRVFRVLFDGSEVDGYGDTLEAAYLDCTSLSPIALPVDVTDANMFPNIAAAASWAKRDD